MKFIHVYNERSFEGLVKNNFINEDSGFKIQHAFSVPEDLKFNSFAAKGGRLYNMIREGNYPFYVDRISGGITYHDYTFDKALISAYEDMLGDWFLGFQLHESASNRRRDWKNILQRMDGEKGPYNEEVLRERSWRKNAIMPNGTVLEGFSQGNSALYSKMKFAENTADFHREIERMFLLRIQATGGHILPCDSYYLYTYLQNKLGMKSFMPEIGCQIANTRVALALARGMAKANGKTWGSYYETWICHKTGEYSMPCYNNDLSNEWYLTQKTHSDDFTTRGANGGSSRLLQKRLYYHSLMSGADYFAEEWGLNCSYSDMNTFELSPYGLAKKEFIEDARAFRGVKLVTPFAIVLPTSFECLQIGAFDPIGTHRTQYLGLDIEGEEKDFVGHIDDVIKLIYMRHGEAFGNESHIITNSRFGELFDIVYEDATDEALSKYEYLVDATADGRIAKAKGDRFNVLESGDLVALEARLCELEREVMPCVCDKLCWLVSTDDSGKRYISIFNNEGNERTHEKGDTVRHEADATVALTFKAASALKAVKLSSNDIKVARKDDKTFVIDMPATQFAIFEF